MDQIVDTQTLPDPTIGYPVMDQDDSQIADGATAADQSKGEKKTDNVLTEEKILALVEKALQGALPKALDEHSRKSQSQMDKLEARIKKETEATIKRLQTAGTQITPELATAIGRTTRDDITAESQTVEQPEQVRENPPVDPINQAAMEMVQEYGFGLDKRDDPESAEVNTKGTPRQFLKSFEAALQKKKLRLEADKMQTSRKPSPAPPMNTGRISNGIPDSADPMDYLKSAYNKR